jgi:ubiquinone/menaquinone biosynthesis C-methylase UbiE
MSGVTDPSTDRERLVGHAYKDSGPLLARGSIYRFQRDPVPIHEWVLGQLDWDEGVSVLDVGCGPGFYLAAIRELVPSAHAIGMDLSLGMAREARTAGGVLVADAQRLPFRDERFDVVIAAHMLYHVAALDVALTEFARVLHAGGHALIVLNGAAHMVGVRELLRSSLTDLAGPVASELPARSTERITADAARPVLERVLEVVGSERVARVVAVPTAQPVVDYVDSTQHFYVPFLPPDVTWTDLMSRVTERVRSTIADEGVWCTHSDVSCFVCRKH